MGPKAWIPVLVSRATVSAVRSLPSLCVKLNRAAELGIAWYEDMATKLSLSPYDLACDYMLRTNIYHPGAAGRGLPSPMKYRCRKLPAVCEISRADTIACVWLRGDLNLQAKSLMLLGSIPSPKQNPSNHLRLLGFFIDLVAGTGFEPVTFRL
jgi:hypothetical protein